MSEPTTPCTCGCSRSRHTDDGKCHGRNADDTGTCRCTAFHEAPGDAPVNELDQKAELLRTFSQKAGISSRFDSWADLSDRRKDQWRSMAAAMNESGYTIAPRGDVLSAEDRAAIGEALYALPALPDWNGEIVDSGVRVILQRLANGGTA